MSSLEDTNRFQRPALEVIKEIDAQVAKNGRVSPPDFISMVMEGVQRGIVKQTLYSGPKNRLWHMLEDHDGIVALFAADRPVIYPTMKVGWVGCDEVGPGTVEEIITPALALAYWPENMVVVAHTDGLLHCHPFHLKPFTTT